MKFKIFIKRLFKYFIGGGVSVVTDFSLLWFLTSILHVFYLISGTISFVAATTTGYFFHRNLTFKGTTRKNLEGYVYFFVTGILGVIINVSLLALFVEVFHFYYLVAKVFTGAIEGTFHLCTSFFVTFKMPKEE